MALLVAQAAAKIRKQAKEQVVDDDAVVQWLLLLSRTRYVTLIKLLLLLLLSLSLLLRAPPVRQHDSTSHFPARCVDTRKLEHSAKVQKSNNLLRDVQVRRGAREATNIMVA
jgi:hypothetical protein